MINHVSPLRFKITSIATCHDVFQCKFSLVPSCFSSFQLVLARPTWFHLVPARSSLFFFRKCGTSNLKCLKISFRARARYYYSYTIGRINAKKVYEVNADIKYIKTCKKERVAPTFTKVNISLKNASFKFKCKIINLIMETEIQNKH